MSAFGLYEAPAPGHRQHPSVQRHPPFRATGVQGVAFFFLKSVAAVIVTEFMTAHRYAIDHTLQSESQSSAGSVPPSEPCSYPPRALQLNGQKIWRKCSVLLRFIYFQTTSCWLYSRPRISIVFRTVNSLCACKVVRRSTFVYQMTEWLLSIRWLCALLIRVAVTVHIRNGR